jgi:hypothetical protein
MTGQVVSWLTTRQRAGHRTDDHGSDTVAQVRRYTEQLVIVAAPDVANTVRAAARLYGVSEASVMRDLIDAGMGPVLRRYAEDAGEDHAVAAARLTEIGKEIEIERAELRAQRDRGRHARTTTR